MVRATQIALKSKSAANIVPVSLQSPRLVGPFTVEDQAVVQLTENESRRFSEINEVCECNEKMDRRFEYASKIRRAHSSHK